MSQFPTDLKALIFDVDGTLAETERDGHRVAFNHAFQSHQLDWNWSIDLYGKLTQISGGKERINYYIKEYQPIFSTNLPLEQFIKQLHQTKTQFYQQLLATGSIPLRLGVKRLITEARAKGIRLAIATTSAYPNALALIEKHLDPSWFEVIAAGDIVPQKKPAPDIYLYVLDKMNLKPENCLVFEDTEHGLTAATKAGLKTIITINNYTKNQEFSQAYWVLNHLGEPDQSCRILQGKQANFDYFTLDNCLS
ncbi:MAG: HAD family hydrolase [Microcystaceae cyanobacterium]